jgi:GT2 family glycosyltransferase
MRSINSVYLIIPVHNRKAITLRCLQNLKSHDYLDKYSVIVIDDGSTDGTSELIEAQYPQVFLIKGNGNLWWTGAIRLGMEFAYQQGAEYLIWMNDDTLPSPESLSLMVRHCCQNPKLIVSSQCYFDKDFQFPTYGGQKKGFLSPILFHTPIGKTYPCDCMSGNLVCFPRSVIDDIDLPPSNFLPHHQADIVYTWMAKQAGYQLVVLGDATAICELNPHEEGWVFSSPAKMIERWKLMFSYKSNMYPPAYWHYCISFHRYMAPAAFILAYFKMLIFTVFSLLFPSFFLKRIKQIYDYIFFKDDFKKVSRERISNDLKH